MITLIRLIKFSILKAGELKTLTTELLLLLF